MDEEELPSPTTSSQMDEEESTSSTPSVEDALLAELDSFIRGNAAVYSCDGAIPISNLVPIEAKQDSKEDLSVLAPQMTLRWERQDESGRVLRFPLANQSDVDMLAEDCLPAVFGQDGKDVLDPSYRRALAMDSDKFSIDFCPYATGIVDRVKDILLPHIGSVDDAKGATVVAQLYKLNIYRGPSDHFKAHVDTPRKETQFGSLVVCLPSAHTGGQLQVRHHGHEENYNWSQSQDAPFFVQWAAFYSDCEHEIRSVTEGYRITLTYNLHCQHRILDISRNLGQGLNAVRVENLTLYRKIRETLDGPGFFADGGLLGIFCSHAYPTKAEYVWAREHLWATRQQGSRTPLIILKGRDMVLFAILKHLGMKVQLRPIIMHPEAEYGGVEHDPDDAWIGNTPGAVVLSNDGGEGIRDAEILEEFGDYYTGVKWLQDNRLSQHAAMVHLRYGNQAELEVKYGSFALMVQIPPHAERVDLADKKRD